MKEKFITFPKDHRIPSKNELRGKTYCKYHSSWNHTTNACWGFRNVIQDKINKGILKFLEKKEAMEIYEDPFPLVASINTISFDLRALIESKKVGKLSPRKVWVPEYCLVCVDKLKKEWFAVCTDPPSGRNSMKGIQQGTEQHNRFSKEIRLSLKRKMNSPGDGFVSPREKVVERPTPPWGRFNVPRENDVDKFRECSSRNRAFSPRGKFTPLNDKVIGKVTFPRKKANKKVFPR